MNGIAKFTHAVNVTNCIIEQVFRNQHPGRVRLVPSVFIGLGHGNTMVDLICHKKLFGILQIFLPDLANGLIQTQAFDVLIIMLKVAGHMFHRIESAFVFFSKLIQMLTVLVDLTGKIT